MQRCDDCGLRPFPPRAHCPECGGRVLTWRAVSGRGSVYSFTIARRPPHPVFAGHDALVIAIIELEEGARMISNVGRCAPASVRIGRPVCVAFEPIDDSDVVLPVFQPSEAPDGPRMAS